jgi:hypothetical protein
MNQESDFMTAENGWQLVLCGTQDVACNAAGKIN